MNHSVFIGEKQLKEPEQIKLNSWQKIETNHEKTKDDNKVLWNSMKYRPKAFCLIQSLI